MQTVVIGWEHLDVDGQTCERCSDTGALLHALVRDLNALCEPRRVRVVLHESLLSPARLADSNRITVDGRPLDQLLPGVRVASSECPSCGALLDAKVQCRTVTHHNASHAVPPPWMIRQAVCRAANCCR